MIEELPLIPVIGKSFKIDYSILLLKGPRISNPYSNKRMAITLTEMVDESDAKESFEKYVNFLFPDEEAHLEIHLITEIYDK